MAKNTVDENYERSMYYADLIQPLQVTELDMLAIELRCARKRVRLLELDLKLLEEKNHEHNRSQERSTGGGEASHEQAGAPDTGTPEALPERSNMPGTGEVPRDKADECGPGTELSPRKE